MGTQERRNMEKAELKKKIMNAAMEIIQKDGYEKLSLRKIAKLIDYSPTTIYLYYDHKAQIISDMAETLYAKVMANVLAVAAENPHWPVDIQVQHMIHTFITRLCSESEMTKTIMYSGQNVIFSNENTNGTPTNAGLLNLDQLLEEGISQGIFKLEAAHTSWILVSALLGFVLCAIENNLCSLSNFNDYVEQFTGIILGGIRQ